MKRRRFIYVCRNFKYPSDRIDSDDPRANNFGLIGAAMFFGRKLAQRDYGQQGELLHVSPMVRREREPRKPGARGIRPAAWTIYEITIGFQNGEVIKTDLALRIGNPRGARRYYEQPAFVQSASDNR